MTKNLDPSNSSNDSPDQNEEDHISSDSPLKKFLDAAENGDGESQYILGCMYRDGTGTLPHSWLMAEKWLITAFKNNTIESLLDIAFMLSKGYKIKDESFELKSVEDCYRKILESDLSSELLKEKTQKKLNDLQQDKPSIPTIFTSPSSKSSKKKGKSKDETEGQTQEEFPIKNLDDFIGLEKVKKQIKILENLATFNASRQKAGLIIQAQSNHLLFTGNSGTGKTEIARLMGQIYKDAGLLSFGHVIEVDRGGLVGEYIGHTAVKTADAIHRASGGILFIDEAHALWSDSGRDFGREALSTLVKAMEDGKDNLVVIMAGYPQHMDFLMRMNPGLNSRIKHHLYFDDYTEQELFDIYMQFAQDNDFIVHKDAKPAIQSLMKKALRYLGEDFGNGRYARNCFEKTIEKMAYRVSCQKSKAKKVLKTIMFMDVPTFEDMAPGKERKTAL